MKQLLVLTLSLFTVLFCTAQKANDTTAIKTLLEKESSTWRSGNVAEHAACWHIQPYSRILVSTSDGNCYDVPPASVINPPNGMMGKGGIAVNSNYLFSIYKNNAWVSHDEVSISVDGIKTYSHEIRLLEKIKGQWKLVGQSIHIYNPK